MGGESLETLQDLLGHTDSKTTQIYRHFVDEHLQQAVDKVRLGPVDLNGS
jgi:site-specific recombinase XerD